MLVRRAFFNEIVILSLWVIILVKNGNAMATFPRGISHSGVLYAINDPLKHPIVDTWMKMNEEKLQKEKLVMDMVCYYLTYKSFIVHFWNQLIPR